MVDEKTMILKDKAILITGGTGSLAQSFVKVALEYNPSSIRIYSRNEFFQHTMQEQFQNPKLRFFIGDVRDLDRLKRAMKHVDYVLHTAALKHVPICEYNPIEAIKTNIVGSMNVIEAALDCGVEKTLNVSSDKAVNPINLYGATKLVGEKLFTDANVYGGCFASVRLGNLENSKGSIIEKINKGEKLKITDPNMTRLFIPLEDAAQFCIDVFKMMRGGEIFVPKNMVLKYVGDLIPNREVVGRRPGEKMNETPFNEDDLYKLEERETCYVIKH